MEKIGPWSISALLVTLVLLFAFQGESILAQPLVIALLAVPIPIMSVILSGASGRLAATGVADRLELQGDMANPELSNQHTHGDQQDHRVSKTRMMEARRQP